MNCDNSVRILQFAATDEFTNLNDKEKEEIILKFININEKEKPKSFRQLSNKDVYSFFQNFNKNLKEKIKNDLAINSHIEIIRGSDSNKDEADAKIIYLKNNLPRQINLEMKFGAETLANIGQKYMNSIFCLNSESEFNFSKMNKTIKEYQRKNIDSGIEEENQLLKHLRNKLRDITRDLNEKIKLIPNSKEINKLLAFTGNRLETNTKVIKYKISANEIKKMHIYEINDSWEIESIKLSEDSQRIQIMLKTNSIKLKFLLNWKNNYEYPKGKKRSAKTGGTCSSWNVWVIND